MPNYNRNLKTRKKRSLKKRSLKNNRRLSQKGAHMITRITGNYGHVTESLEILFRKNSEIKKFIDFLNQQPYNITKANQVDPNKVYQNVIYKKTLSFKPDTIIKKKYNIIKDFISFRKHMLKLFTIYKKFNTYNEGSTTHWDSGLSPIKPNEKKKIIPNYTEGNDNVNDTRKSKMCSIIDKALGGIRGKSSKTEYFTNNFYYDMMRKLAKKHRKFFENVDELIQFIKDSLNNGQTYFDSQSDPDLRRFDSESQTKDARERRVGEMSDNFRCGYVQCGRVGEWGTHNPLPVAPQVTAPKDVQNKFKKEMKKYNSCKKKLEKENKKFPRTPQRPDIPPTCTKDSLDQARQEFIDEISAE